METYNKRNNQPLMQCYFCGDEMLPQHLEMHVKHCGCVLEPCPQQCGLYVQRQYKSHHSSWCKNEKIKLAYRAPIQTDLVTFKKQLKQEIQMQLENGIQKVIADGQQVRLNDLSQMKTSINEVTSVITHLKFSLNQTRVDVEELRNYPQSCEQCGKLLIQFNEWKTNQNHILNDMKAAVNSNLNAEISELHKDNILRSKSVNDLLDLNEVIIDTQDQYTNQLYHLEEDVKSFQQFLAEENIMISGLWKEQLEEIKKLKSKFEKNEVMLQHLIEEQKAIKKKLEFLECFSKDLNKANCGYDKIKPIQCTKSEGSNNEVIDEGKVCRERLKSLEIFGKVGSRTLSSNTCSAVFDDKIIDQQNEIAIRLETLEKLTTEIQKNCARRNSVSSNTEQSDISTSINELSSEQVIIKRRLELLEHLTQNLEQVKCKVSTKTVSGLDSAVSTNGHMMWTISNFNQKLEEGKGNQTEIISPSFYTSENGYKMQIRAYLNGIGQWEGRHMIISLHVLRSHWDTQLTWPRRMKVVLCLRDQEHIQRKAKDIVKSFTSSPALKGFETPCLKMFIPHRILYTRSYLKNNVIIIDVKASPV